MPLKGAHVCALLPEVEKAQMARMPAMPAMPEPPDPRGISRFRSPQLCQGMPVQVSGCL